MILQSEDSPIHDGGVWAQVAVSGHTLTPKKGGNMTDRWLVVYDVVNDGVDKWFNFDVGELFTECDKPCFMWTEHCVHLTRISKEALEEFNRLKEAVNQMFKEEWENWKISYYPSLEKATQILTEEYPDCPFTPKELQEWSEQEYKADLEYNLEYFLNDMQDCANGTFDKIKREEAEEKAEAEELMELQARSDAHKEKMRRMKEENVKIGELTFEELVKMRREDYDGYIDYLFYHYKLNKVAGGSLYICTACGGRSLDFMIDPKYEEADACFTCFNAGTLALPYHLEYDPPVPEIETGTLEDEDY